MLTCVSIQNYRGFKSYRMEGLARVNLLVGKNNSGKTALLEGIQFLTSGGDPAVLAQVAGRRGEIVVGRDEPTESLGRRVFTDVAHFFHGHALGENIALSFSGDNGYPTVGVKIVAHKSERSATAPEGRAGVSGVTLKISGPAAKGERDDVSFAVSREGGVNFDQAPRFRRGSAPRQPLDRHVLFVGSDSLNSIDLANMWDEIIETKQELEVAEAMRVLESDLDSVHFKTGMLAAGYFPARGGIVVGIKGQDSRLPLGSLGDGMRRLMAIATSLAFTKNGCLFVDEIDTGLHYSVMPDMWKLVIAKAIAANVQVFATTHSWDCIEGLSLLCQREPGWLSEVAIHKIDRALPNSVAFSGQSLVRMLKHDIDPRS